MRRAPRSFCKGLLGSVILGPDKITEKLFLASVHFCCGTRGGIVVSAQVQQGVHDVEHKLRLRARASLFGQAGGDLTADYDLGTNPGRANFGKIEAQHVSRSAPSAIFAVQRGDSARGYNCQVDMVDTNLLLRCDEADKALELLSGDAHRLLRR